MSHTTHPDAVASGAESLIIERHFDAPREWVWRAWTEPARCKQWWGPKDFTTPHCEMDVREGGKYLYCMRSPEGRDYWGTGTYLEVVPFERLVYTDAFADAEGNPVPASHYGMDGDWPLEMRVTVTFEDAGAGTRLVLRHEGLPAGAMRDMTGDGWRESFDKLAKFVRA